MGPPYPYVRGLSDFPCPPMSLRSLIRLALAQYQWLHHFIEPLLATSLMRGVSVLVEMAGY
jgi:hypothetical protein